MIEHIFAFVIGVLGCIAVGLLLDWLIPITLVCR
jgi:hypothetical protein